MVSLISNEIIISTHSGYSASLFYFFPLNSCCFLLFLLQDQFILCNWTYVWNKVGICFFSTVSRGRCVSSRRPVPTWPHAADQKPLLASGQLVRRPLPIVCVCVCVSSLWSVCVHTSLREHVGWMDVLDMRGGRGKNGPHKCVLDCFCFTVYIHTFLVISLQEILGSMCFPFQLIKNHISLSH